MSSDVITDPIPTAIRHIADRWLMGQTLSTGIDIEAVFSHSGQSIGRHSFVFIDLPVRSQAQTPLAQAECDLDILLDAENANGYRFKPTGRAYHYARRRLLAAYDIMEQSFFRPSMDSDGEGGIDMEWAYGERTVILCCRGRSTQKDYVYFESQNLYGGDDYSPEYFRDRLNWLIHEQ